MPAAFQSVSVSLSNGKKFDLRVPAPGPDGRLDQDEEWCEVQLDGEWQRFRFHDYHEIYNVPGLYETIFYEMLECNSPERVVGLLSDVMQEQGAETDELKVLDVGAGNGIVAQVLKESGAAEIVGVDIIPEAKDAALRDRSEVYEDYKVADLTNLPEDHEEDLRDANLNCLTCVAALGYGDIPDAAFLKALDLIETPGWLAFNIKESFLSDSDPHGFNDLVRRLAADEVIRLEAYRRYQHRLSVAGEPLHYLAVVARKLKDVPDKYLQPHADAKAATEQD